MREGEADGSPVGEAVGRLVRVDVGIGVRLAVGAGVSRIVCAVGVGNCEVSAGTYVGTKAGVHPVSLSPSQYDRCRSERQSRNEDDEILVTPSVFGRKEDGWRGKKRGSLTK